MPRVICGHGDTVRVSWLRARASARSCAFVHGLFVQPAEVGRQQRRAPRRPAARRVHIAAAGSRRIVSESTIERDACFSPIVKSSPLTTCTQLPSICSGHKLPAPYAPSLEW